MKTQVEVESSNIGLFFHTRYLSQWSFQVKHIKGKDNLINDYLSRNLQSLIPQLSLHPCVYILSQTHPLPQALPLQTLMISLI